MNLSKTYSNAFIQLLLLGLILTSCEAVDCCNETQMTSSNLFANPVSGSVSRYVAIQGEEYLNLSNQHFTYMEDTLELEIVEVSANKITIEERYTPHSAMLKKIRSGEILTDSVYHFTMSIEELGIEFMADNEKRFNSRLFNHYFNTGFALSTVAEGRRTCESLGLKIDPCARNLRLENWVFDDITYEEIYGLYDDNFINQGAPAFGWIYSASAGIPMTFSVFPESQSWSAWKWIP